MSYAAEVLADSPLHYWDLQETSGTNGNDQGSGNQDVTYNGCTLNQAGPVAGAAKSVLFNGTTDGADAVGGATAQQLNSDFSIEFWAKNVSLPSVGNWDGILGKYHNYSGGTGWGIFYDDTGRLTFKRDGSQISTPTDAAYLLSNSVWKHYVFTYDEAGTRTKWYVNGVVADDSSVTFPDSTDTTHPIGLGWAYDEGAGNNYLAHVAIYASKLKTEAVARHYAVGAATSAPFDVLHADAAPLVGKIVLPAGELLVKAVNQAITVGKVAFPAGDLSVQGVAANARVGWANAYTFALRVRSRLTVRMPRR